MIHHTTGPTAPTDPTPDERARTLLSRMTLEEKLAQLVGFWVDESGTMVAPGQAAETDPRSLTRFSRNGLGQLTRVFGTRPVEPTGRAAWLRATQRDIVGRSRQGIPALAHEECLTGLVAWGATTFPTPLAWGAACDPGLVEEMGRAIGESMRSIGVHQGLAPVLDVVRDARWGRVEECIGEDPYLVGEVGTAYVRGLQAGGTVATLKHFVGYSASRAGRNLAPVHAGPREVAELLVPFEMALLDGGARSVMHSYAEIDQVPVAADATLLTGVLRDRWGFEGTVVADYFGIEFLQSMHGVARDRADAAVQALTAGIDVELPSGDTYLEPLAEAVRSGQVDEALVDRAALRVLRQKAELGLLDAAFEEPAGPETIDLDPPAHRALAARLAERSIILVSNDGTLPLAADARVALIGPNADRVPAMFGCYAFINHVLDQYPGHDPGIEVPTVLEGLSSEHPASVTHTPGCAVDDDDRSGFEHAVSVARDADVVVAVMGDQAGLFGRGTVGEGCDRDDLELPGVQRPLLESLLGTGTPVVLVLITGRPYAVGWALERCAAVVQAFFPGEEGGPAVAGVLTGRVNPSGRLPVTLPRSGGSQPFSYLHPQLGAPTKVSTLDTTPAAPFGHGLSFTSFDRTIVEVSSEAPTSGSLTVDVEVRNTGDRRGGDVVQLYAHDPVASVTRPLSQLIGFARVELDPGQSTSLRFTVPTTRVALTDRRGRRVVEPGEVTVWVGASSVGHASPHTIHLTGDIHTVSIHDARQTAVAGLSG